MTDSHPVAVFVAGGTIDKSYPTGQCGAYAFEFHPVPAAVRIISRSRSSSSAITVLKVVQKDSRDLTDEDRQALLEAILKSGRNRATGEMCCVVTHGTDTLIDTALYLNKRLQETADIAGGVILLTGAFIPEQMKDTDADFSLGFAVGCAKMHQTLAATKNNSNVEQPTVIVLVAIQGELFSAGNVERRQDGSFASRSSQ